MTATAMSKSFPCWEQYLAMAFAQLTYRESLRDIEACLGAVGNKLYHMGFSTSVLHSAVSRGRFSARSERA